MSAFLSSPTVEQLKRELTEALDIIHHLERKLQRAETENRGLRLSIEEYLLELQELDRQKPSLSELEREKIKLTLAALQKNK